MRRHLGPDDVIAEMRMSRSSFEGTWVLCEGDTDRAVLDRFVDQDNARVQPCHGKRGVLTVLSKRRQARLGMAVAVVDTDFWWVSPPNSPPNVLLTDDHDLEAMLVASPALEAIQAEHTNADQLAAFLRRTGFASLRELVYDRCRPSATLRLVNNEGDLGLRFARLPITNYLEPKQLAFDAARYVKDVHARSDTPATLKEVGELLVAELRKDYEPRLLCQGHDMVQILTYALRECGFASRPPSAYHPKLIEKDLRLAYDSRYFRKTDLYREICGWDAGRGQKLLDV